KNKYAFVSLSRFAGAWTLSADARVIDRGSLPALDVAPGQEQVVTMPLKPIQARPGREYFLRLSFTLPKDESWAEAGFEVASEQFTMPVKPVMAARTAAERRPVKLTTGEAQITITGEDFSVVFDKAEGTISKLERNSKNMVLAGGGPKLHLWRAPHRNDDVWAYSDWEKLGLTELKRETVKFAAEAIEPNTVRVNLAVLATGKGGFRVLHSAQYTVRGDGSIAVDNAVMPE